MHRRDFMLSAAALAGLPTVCHAFMDVEYSPQSWRELRDTDQTVVLFFRASWSLTCQIKEEMLQTLIRDNPEFAKLVFVNINWDTFGPSRMAERLNVRRRSTLVVMKQGKEIVRLENEPEQNSLKRLLETAAAA